MIFFSQLISGWMDKLIELGEEDNNSNNNIIQVEINNKIKEIIGPFFSFCH